MIRLLLIATLVILSEGGLTTQRAEALALENSEEAVVRLLKPQRSSIQEFDEESLNQILRRLDPVSGGQFRLLMKRSKNHHPLFVVPGSASRATHA